MRTALPFLLASLAALAGCSRSVPAEFPRASAASAEASAAPPARVGLAIEEEPPLPGEAREGWEALDRGTPAAGHHGHHGHHGHGATGGGHEGHGGGDDAE